MDTGWNKRPTDRPPFVGLMGERHDQQGRRKDWCQAQALVVGLTFPFFSARISTTFLLKHRASSLNRPMFRYRRPYIICAKPTGVSSTYISCTHVSNKGQPTNQPGRLQNPSYHNFKVRCACCALHFDAAATFRRTNSRKSNGKNKKTWHPNNCLTRL